MTEVGLSLMPEPEFAAATLPLFEDGLVDAVEWSFDMGWGPSGNPEWLDGLIDDFAAEGRLDGHGVSFSLLSRHPRQEAWLAWLDAELVRRPYRRVSEHVGFMSAGDVGRSTPLPLPHHPEVVALGRAQVERLTEHVGAPVGLENLATSLSRRDAMDQGALCEDLLAPTDGWIVLDLHNLWCQAATFGVSLDELMDGYPLGRVRELHVSGGSWWEDPESGRRIRRDTHDGPIPQEVLAFLPTALERCPGVETVVVERIGWSFGSPDRDEEFGDSYRAVREIVGAAA